MSEEVVGETVIEEPVPQLVAVGTRTLLASGWGKPAL